MKRWLLLLLIPLHVFAQAPSSRAPAHHPDYVPPVRRLPATGGDQTLTVISWNVKHLGRRGFASSRAAPLLKEADVVTLQEVNVGESGMTALKTIARALETLTGTRICMALSEIPSGGRERYAYLWRDDRIAFVKANGDILDRCPVTALTTRLGVRHASKILREPAYSTFFFRPRGEAFVLASIHLRPSGKRPQDEVEPLFSTIDHILLPVIVAGDYNLDSVHPSFAGARSTGFVPAFTGEKTSLKMKKRELSKPYDNFWFRGLSLREKKVTNLHVAFPDLEPRTIYKELSDHCPITGRFEFAAAQP